MIRRNVRVVLQLSKAEAEHLDDLVVTSGLNRSVVLRKLIAGKDIKPRRPAEYVQVIRELNAIGNNLNQIARSANAFGLKSGNLADCQRLLTEVRDAVREL